MASAKCDSHLGRMLSDDSFSYSAAICKGEGYRGFLRMLDYINLHVVTKIWFINRKQPDTKQPCLGRQTSQRLYEQLRLPYSAVN